MIFLLNLQRGSEWRPGAHHDQRTVARGQTERVAATFAGRGRRRCGWVREPEATEKPATSATAAATGGGEREHHHNGCVTGKRVQRETVAGVECATAGRPDGAQQTVGVPTGE